MAKFFGIVGYAEMKETSPGVWTEEIIERSYKGDITKNSKRNEGGEYLNDNIRLSNTISILCDAYAYEHFFAIKYVEWMGAKWKVTDVEVKRPRLILSIGGVYNDISC